MRHADLTLARGLARELCAFAAQRPAPNSRWGGQGCGASRRAAPCTHPCAACPLASPRRTQASVYQAPSGCGLLPCQGQQLRRPRSLVLYVYNAGGQQRKRCAALRLLSCSACRQLCLGARRRRAVHALRHTRKQHVHAWFACCCSGRGAAAQFRALHAQRRGGARRLAKLPYHHCLGRRHPGESGILFTFEPGEPLNLGGLQNGSRRSANPGHAHMHGDERARAVCPPLPQPTGRLPALPRNAAYVHTSKCTTGVWGILSGEAAGVGRRRPARAMQGCRALPRPARFHGRPPVWGRRPGLPAHPEMWLFGWLSNVFCLVLPVGFAGETKSGQSCSPACLPRRTGACSSILPACPTAVAADIEQEVAAAEHIVVVTAAARGPFMPPYTKQASAARRSCTTPACRQAGAGCVLGAGCACRQRSPSASTAHLAALCAALLSGKGPTRS